MKDGALHLVEILCVTALLLLFGLTTYTLIAVGGDTYSRLLDKREVVSDLRIASSYVSMRIRQNDVAGGVEHRISGIGDILVLTRPYEDGTVLETRIYAYNGYLVESIDSPEEPLNPDLGVEIAPLQDFSVSTDGDMITVSLKRGDLRRALTLTLRSEARLLEEG